MPPTWPPAVLFNHIRAALRQVGRLSINKETLQSLLVDAGFVDVHVKTLKLPTGIWPKNPDLKQAGAFLTVCAEKGGYESYGLALCTRVLGMNEKETVRLCREACVAHHMKGVHAYFE